MRDRIVKTSAAGFSLVEVMVALLVICVGMLGIAKLNAVMLSNTGTSRVRALVAQEAASLADSMHADRDFWDGSSPDWSASGGDLSVTATEAAGATTFAAAGSANLATDLGASPDCKKGGGAAPCSSVNMAAYDLNQWATALAGVLQNSSSNIDCASSNSVVTCTINVQWTENAVAANSQETTAGAPANLVNESYQLVIEP